MKPASVDKEYFLSVAQQHFEAEHRHYDLLSGLYEEILAASSHAEIGRLFDAIEAAEVKHQEKSCGQEVEIGRMTGAVLRECTLAEQQKLSQWITGSAIVAQRLARRAKRVAQVMESRTVRVGSH